MIPYEAEGEMQEWTGICQLAVGLSRQLYGLTIASEQTNDRVMEQWHPLGVGRMGVFTERTPVGRVGASPDWKVSHNVAETVRL